MEHLHRAHHTVSAFPTDLLNQIHPCHQVMAPTKPHRAGGRVWKRACAATRQEVKELNPDVIAECYLEAKYCHYDTAELTNLSDINANFAHLANSDTVLTVSEMTTSRNWTTHVHPGSRTLRRSIPSGWNIINPGRLARSALKNLEVE